MHICKEGRGGGSCIFDVVLLGKGLEDRNGGLRDFPWCQRRRTCRCWTFQKKEFLAEKRIPEETGIPCRIRNSLQNKEFLAEKGI